MAGTARRGARPPRSHCGRGPRGDAADDGWPVLVAGLGWRCKLEGASGRVPGMVTGEGAHLGGVPAAGGGGGGAQAGGCARRCQTSRWWLAVTPMRSCG
jgi:hypothetical protein